MAAVETLSEVDFSTFCSMGPSSLVLELQYVPKSGSSKLKSGGVREVNSIIDGESPWMADGIGGAAYLNLEWLSSDSAASTHPKAQQVKDVCKESKLQIQ